MCLVCLKCAEIEEMFLIIGYDSVVTGILWKVGR